MTGSCAVCRAPATNCCSGCRSTFYCSRDHQKQHWKVHKGKCCCWKLSENSALGRHLEATRDVRAGEVILEEEPLVVGPKIACLPTCLGCLRRVGGDYYCRGCGWPLCGAACEQHPRHLPECRVMKAAAYKALGIVDGGRKEAAYCTVTPLRCLLLSETDPQRYDQLSKLQSHLDVRRDTPLYSIFKANVVGFIRDALKLDLHDEETILRMAAILDTNAFDVSLERGSVKARAVYWLASMMSHDCKPNTKHVFKGHNFKIVVVATVPIKKGEVISASYTQLLWGTLLRRAHLKNAKCFDCRCDRCSDPTELGTYVGAILCSQCDNSEGKVVSSDPLDPSAIWKCEVCDHTIPARQISWGNEAVRKEVASLDKTSPHAMEEFLFKYSGTLHNFNGHALEVKYALTQMYGNVPKYTLADLTDKQISRKIELCHELLEVADVLDSGMSHFRGTLLYDLQAAMVVQAKRDFNNEKITKSAAQEIMGDAMELLQEAAKILQSEPDMTDMLEEKLKALAALWLHKPVLRFITSFSSFYCFQTGLHWTQAFN